MKTNKRGRSLRALCAELHDDDGVDPREAFSRRVASATATKEHRKTRQLCKQAARAIASAMSGETGDALLHDAEIVDVLPGTDGSYLRVQLRLSPGAGPADPREMLARVENARGFLRSQLAAEITRKRVPDLRFEWAGEILP